MEFVITFVVQLSLDNLLDVLVLIDFLNPVDPRMDLYSFIWQKARGNVRVLQFIFSSLTIFSSSIPVNDPIDSANALVMIWTVNAVA